MYFGDRYPPHFHVEYQSYTAFIRITALGLIHGTIPPRVMGMIAEWASLHQEELLADWERTRSLEPLEKIAPLP